MDNPTESIERLKQERDEARKMISRIAATAHQKWTVAKLMQKQMNSIWDELLGEPLVDFPDREKQV